MNWQWMAAIISVGVAASYLGWRSWRTWGRKAAGCGGGCSCPGKKGEATARPSELIPADQLLVRLSARR
jgi:hypothetical protein